ncbi:MAG: hypothetical protein HWN67_19170 [Candidatus Helarchaeota archaeon]|nr:hypothetical protein [Candidatus Helarchaeota archaeon]
MNNTTQKIIIIWVFTLIIRILLCFIWPNKLFLDEQGFINFDIIGYDLILKYLGYVPKFIGFTVIIAPIYYAFNFFGVRIFLAVISSLGVFTIYYLMKNFTKNENIILTSIILYNFNNLVLYYSCFIVTENLYYPLAPLILAFFFKHINTTHTRKVLLETEKSENYRYKYLIIAGLMGITLSIRITFGLVYVLGVIFLIFYYEGEKFTDKISLNLFLKEFIVILLFGIMSLTPVLIFSIINSVSPLNILLQTIFWNIGFLQPNYGSPGYIFLYIITILIPIFIYLPFLIKETLNFKDEVINIFFLAWIVVQHVFYFGHQYEIALMRWNVSTFIGYFILFIKGYERADQEFLFLDKTKYLILFLIYSITLAFVFKIAFIEEYNDIYSWVLILGIAVICGAFGAIYYWARKKS